MCVCQSAHMHVYIYIYIYMYVCTYVRIQSFPSGSQFQFHGFFIYLQHTVEGLGRFISTSQGIYRQMAAQSDDRVTVRAGKGILNSLSCSSRSWSGVNIRILRRTKTCFTVYESSMPVPQTSRPTDRHFSLYFVSFHSIWKKHGTGLKIRRKRVLKFCCILTPFSETE